METLIESIRLAIAPDTTPEARATGAHACRAILKTLEPTPPESIDTRSAPSGAAQLTNLVTALRGAPADQLLDLAIGKLRTMVPNAPAPPPRPGFSVPLIQVPQP